MSAELNGGGVRKSTKGRASRFETSLQPCNPASCLLPPASCLLPPASCLLPPAACLLPPASCLLPPASCLLPPASSSSAVAQEEGGGPRGVCALRCDTPQSYTVFSVGHEEVAVSHVTAHNGMPSLKMAWPFANYPQAKLNISGRLARLHT